MISELEVKNFKSLRDVHLEFDDLTVFVGKNNSGKSAAMESLVYFQKAVENNVTSASDFPETDCVGYDFNDTDELFFRKSGFQADEVSVSPTFDLSVGEESKQLSDELSRANVQNSPLELEVTARLSDESVDEVVRYAPNDQLIFRPTSDYTKQTRKLNTPYGQDGAGFQEGLFDYETVTDADEGDLLSSIKQSLDESLSNTYYITDSRDIEDWGSDPIKQDFVGHHGEDTVSMLHGLRDDPDAFERVVEAMSEIADDTEGVVADMYKSKTRTELVDADTGELFNIVSSGAGLRRILPIIVQISSTKSGGTVLIEEPEIGVYPKTQQGLIDFIISQIEERDIQVVMSTHSATMLWKTQSRIDDGQGTAYEFEKSDGETKAIETDIQRVTSTFEDYYGSD